MSFLEQYQPPTFNSQQKDQVVYDSVYYDFGGYIVNLILHCNVTGKPKPSVRWFKGSSDIGNHGVLLSNGSIGLNIRESSGETYYHCKATNKISKSASATIRSRDIKVSICMN